MPWVTCAVSSNKAIITFQSLFWWKYCPGKSFKSDFNFFGLEFQSLFWWKYCPGLKHWVAPTTHRPCFNPCSGGSIALGSASACKLLKNMSGFNPCSGGSIALGSWKIASNSVWIIEFQSLFWWKYCPGSFTKVTPPPSLIKFQSLFWWKYCPGPNPAIVDERED